MPRHVDPLERRAEITNAAIRILARSGPRALTLKSLAEELGGSITLVTHYVSNRADLFTVLTEDLTDSYEDELRKSDEGVDPFGRLWNLVTWMVPADPDDIEMERGRIALISHRDEHTSIENFFQRMERRMRDLLRDRLTGLVDDRDLDHGAAYLRAVCNGLVLSAVEHPERWPKSQIEAVLRTALRGLGLQPPAEPQADARTSPAGKPAPKTRRRKTITNG